MSVTAELLASQPEGTYLILGVPGSNVFWKDENGMWVMGYDTQRSYTWYGGPIAETLDKSGMPWSLS